MADADQKEKSVRPSADDIESIARRLDEGSIDFVRFEQPDYQGIARSKTVPVRHFKRFASKGLNFIEAYRSFGPQGELTHGIGGASEPWPDGLAYPAPSTFRVLPWADSTARVLCEMTHMDGSTILEHPRTICRRSLDQLAELGFKLKTGFEYEFVVVDTNEKPITEGINIFSTLRNNTHEGLVHEILRSMHSVGVDILTANGEYAPGQFEIVFGPNFGVRAADDAFTFKTGVKEICQRNGFTASFMSWPFQRQDNADLLGGVGSAGHFNHSLWSLDGDECAFWDAKSSPKDVSDTMRYWVGGLVKHASALQAFYNPTPNCYRRTVTRSFAPWFQSWGVEDRMTAYRVKNSDSERCYIENRAPGAAANPYLVVAACVAAGIDGIRNKIKPPLMGHAVSPEKAQSMLFPTSLEDALKALQNDAVIVQALGEKFVGEFVKVKEMELRILKIDELPEGASEAEIEVYKDNKAALERSEYFEYL